MGLDGLEAKSCSQLRSLHHLLELQAWGKLRSSWRLRVGLGLKLTFCLSVKVGVHQSLGNTQELSADFFFLLKSCEWKS